MDNSSQESEWWWIDYLEDEMDPSLDRDLELLLEHSAEDRDTFEKFRLLKKWLKDSDAVARWPLEDRLTKVRSRIMQAIEAESQKKPQLEDSRDTKSLSV